jgi:glycosyltransferase involved in cell wall biosynthesis
LAFINKYGQEKKTSVIVPTLNEVSNIKDAKIIFEKATGDLVVMMDADGSHDPKEIPRLIEPILDGYDVSKGSRLLPGGGSTDFTPFRKIGNRTLVSMVNLMCGANYTYLCYGYRAFKREALEKLHCTSKGFEIETEQSILMKKAGLKVKEVPSFEEKRKYGDSYLNYFRYGGKILNVILREYSRDSTERSEK